MELGYIVTAVISVVVGLLLGKFVFAGRSDLAKELKETKEELETIKSKLKHHLTENVVLFKQLDDSYQKLFKQFGETIDDMSGSLDPNQRGTFSLERIENMSSNEQTEHTTQQPKDY